MGNICEIFHISEANKSTPHTADKYGMHDRVYLSTKNLLFVFQVVVTVAVVEPMWEMIKAITF